MSTAQIAKLIEEIHSKEARLKIMGDDLRRLSDLLEKYDEYHARKPSYEAQKTIDILMKRMQNWGAGTTEQPAYQAEQKAKNKEMRDALDANPLAGVEAGIMKPMTDALTKLIRKYE